MYLFQANLYYDFLCNILKWLAAHSEEICIISLNFQGFEESSMKPSIYDLRELVSAAQLDTDTLNIAIGDQTDLSVIIRQLLDEKKRLIFLNQVEANSDAHKCDSYNESLYATTDVTNILTALAQMPSHPPNDKVYTVLQLQGTATSDKDACSTSILDAISLGGSDAMSPLMSTKADFDHSSYPWLVNNVPDNFSSNSLLVIINDFVDNALIRHAINITRKRIDLGTNIL
jgi:hypothetical protein